MGPTREVLSYLLGEGVEEGQRAPEKYEERDQSIIEFGPTLEAADRQGIEQIASFLERRGWLTGRRRLRADLARRSPPLRWLVSRITRLSAGYKRMRRSCWRKLTLDQVLAQYASPRPAQAV